MLRTHTKPVQHVPVCTPHDDFPRQHQPHGHTRRYLLYLSTPASPGSGSGPGSGSAHADLWRALAALADVSGLTDLGTEPPSTQGAGGAAAAVATRAAAEAALPEGAAEVGPRRPRVLRAWFFRQPVTSYQQEQEQAAASTGSGAAALGAGGLPGAVVSVPGPDGSLAGYTHVLQATERVFRCVAGEWVCSRVCAD